MEVSLAVANVLTVALRSAASFAPDWKRYGPQLPICAAQRSFPRVVEPRAKKTRSHRTILERRWKAIKHLYFSM